MTDKEAKEKLEAKLECLKRESSGIVHECDIAMCGNCDLNYRQGTAEEIQEALKTAVTALGKQIPMKPVEGYVFSEWLREILLEKQSNKANARGSCCPACGKYIGSLTIGNGNGFPFCQWCGQAIDWSEND